MPEYDDQALRQGRRRLKALLPKARAEARRAGDDRRTMKAGRGVAQAMVPHLAEDRLDALVIYPAENGGWHADLILKRMPDGVGNVLGTPSASPCATRESAETFGYDLLVDVLLKIDETRSSPPRKMPPVFELHGREVPLFEETFRRLRREAPEFAVGYGSAEAAHERIEEVVLKLSNGDPDGPWLHELDLDGKARLSAVLHMAALSGVLRHPPFAEATPTGHVQSPERH